MTEVRYAVFAAIHHQALALLVSSAGTHGRLGSAIDVLSRSVRNAMYDEIAPIECI